MADTPDFQLGFAAGFKLGSDAKDYRKQIEDFRAAEKSANDARKASSDANDRAQEVWSQAIKAKTDLANDKAAWEAKRDNERRQLDTDADALVALRQQLERREGALPEREAAAWSRENAVKERERAIATREEAADSVKRKYEVLIEKIDAARAAA